MRRSLAGIPGIRAFPVPLQNLRIGSRSGAALYQYTLTSVNQAELYDNAQRLVERVKQAPGFTDVTTDLTLGARQLTPRHRSRRAGALRPDDGRGSLARSIPPSAPARSPPSTRPSNDYAVILETDKARTLDPIVLSKVFVRSSTGQQVRLDSVATVTLGPGPVSVARQSQLPAVTITFNLAPGYTLGEAVVRHARRSSAR